MPLDQIFNALILLKIKEIYPLFDMTFATRQDMVNAPLQDMRSATPTRLRNASRGEENG